MSDRPEDLLVADLEVSVRTADVLASLGARTLGELLALPKIRATRLSLAELAEVFSELGVTYAGVLEPDEPAIDLIEAHGTVEERWNTIAAWLEHHHPAVLEGFRAPATPEQLDAAERGLGVKLPPDFRQFLLLHNGQTIDEPMVWTCSILPVETLVERRDSLAQLYDEPGLAIPGEGVDPAIRAVEYSHEWIPIGVSARGRDFLCLDLDPSSDGTKGQVILIAVDSAGHILLAPNFREFLSLYFTQVQRGEIDLDG